MKKDNDKKKKSPGIALKFVIGAWGAVLLLNVLLVIIWEVTDSEMKVQSFSWITVVISFATFVATSFFSISIYNHNAVMREGNSELSKQTSAVNRRAEAFRQLQFIASNYTIIDFVDHMLIYSEYARYIENLRTTHKIQFHLAEQGITKEDVFENPNDFQYLTLRMPMMILEGKTLGKLTFSRIKIVKENGTHIFLPPDGSSSSALILYNEKDKRNECLINLIIPKDGSFYVPGQLNPFLKVKITLNMESLLRVVIAGSIELYITNPEATEKDGSNRYRINSSQFELRGMPKLIFDERSIDMDL